VVCIRLDQYDFDGLYGQEHKKAAEHLASVLTSALQVLTKCDTIIIYNSLKIFYNIDGKKIRTVAKAIDIVDKIKLFKVRVQNIRTYNSTDL
jgi:UDP-glucose 6-dehydrogenase